MAAMWVVVCPDCGEHHEVPAGAHSGTCPLCDSTWQLVACACGSRHIVSTRDRAFRCPVSGELHTAPWAVGPVDRAVRDLGDTSHATIDAWFTEQGPADLPRDARRFEGRFSWGSLRAAMDFIHDIADRWALDHETRTALTDVVRIVAARRDPREEWRLELEIVPVHDGPLGAIRIHLE